jgi:glyoxylase-like metal-dependent hydrolase (beta-lactamase superfamily II)
MDALWGPMLPVPAVQLHELGGDDVVDVNGLEITALDTPGHAYHHHTLCIGDVAFCGDAAGVHMPGARFITLPAPPPEFDLEAWQLSLARLLGHNLSRIYLTHFGGVDDVEEHLEGLVSTLNQAADFVGKRMRERFGRSEVIKEFIRWNRERALATGMSDEQFVQYETANPVDISVDGIMRYWRKKWEHEGS